MSTKKHTVEVLHHIEKIQQRCKSNHISKIRAPLSSTKSNKMIPLNGENNPIKTIKQKNKSNQKQFTTPSRYGQSITADLRAREDILSVKESLQQRKVQETHYLSRTSSLRSHGNLKKRAHRADQKILIEVEKKGLDETAKNLSWSKVGRLVLQNPEDVSIWETKEGLPLTFRELPVLWDVLGKEKVEREASYRSLNSELAPIVRTMTNRAYEMAMGFGGNGTLPPEDRVNLDTSIAKATQRIYNEYYEREKREMLQCQNEINKLKKTIAKYRSEHRKQMKQTNNTSSTSSSTSSSTVNIQNMKKGLNSNDTIVPIVDDEVKDKPMVLEWHISDKGTESATGRKTANLPLLQLMDILMEEVENIKKTAI
mmetsp:Transcript_27162/g.32083  ORF Transcript_27162/g.32083 Transcript_27162/m.32083 type:complete len:369 (+) Transcript_27162:98-1204(+)